VFPVRYEVGFYIVSPNLGFYFCCEINYVGSVYRFIVLVPDIQAMKQGACVRQQALNRIRLQTIWQRSTGPYVRLSNFPSLLAQYI
jgi:hypothetical protein